MFHQNRTGFSETLDNEVPSGVRKGQTDQTDDGALEGKLYPTF